MYTANTQSSLFFRGYFYFTTAPSIDTLSMLHIWNGQAGQKVAIRITSGLVTQLWNIEDNAQVGSDGPTLSLNTWYSVELALNTTTLASTSVDACINGTSFSSGTINLASGVITYRIGQTATNTTPVYYIDDLAINDSTGSFQNSYPGAGNIIHLRPNAAGDNAGWANGTGSTFAEVDEVTPDDATTYIQDLLGTETSDFNIDSPVMLGDLDTISVVQIGFRGAAATAASADPFVLRVKASASGTVEESSNITLAATAYVTNAVASPRNYALTLYDLPGASTTAWTKAGLDTAQIGIRATSLGVTGARVSTLWMLVDYIPVYTKKWGVKPR